MRDERYYEKREDEQPIETIHERRMKSIERLYSSVRHTKQTECLHHEPYHTQASKTIANGDKHFCKEILFCVNTITVITTDI